MKDLTRPSSLKSKQNIRADNRCLDVYFSTRLMPYKHIIGIPLRDFRKNILTNT